MRDSIEHFAARQAAHLRKKMNEQVKHAGKDAKEEHIHHLRVSIRRLSQCLNDFGQFYPKRETKKSLKRLHKIMDLAAEIRNRDIAVMLIGKGHPALVRTFGKEREQAAKKLAKSLQRWKRHGSN